MAADGWYAANQRLLTAWTRLLRARVATHLSREPEAPLDALEAAVDAAQAELPSPSGLQLVADAFGLSGFERDLVMLCVAAELDGSLAALLGGARSDGRELVTVSVGMAVLPGAHWNALTPIAPLRRHRLLEVLPGPSLVGCALRVEERVLHFVVGLDVPDERLIGIIDPLAPPPMVLAEQQQIAERIGGIWRDSQSAVALCARDRNDARLIAAAAAALVGARLYVARVRDLPTAGGVREPLFRVWEREALLTRGLLLLEVDDDDNDADVQRLVDHLPALAMVSCRDGVKGRERTFVRIDVPPAAVPEQRALWRAALGDDWPAVEGSLDALLAQFTLSALDIAAAVAAMRADRSDLDAAARLWTACRTQSRARLDTMAQRIDGRAGWDDLVLPALEMQTLRAIPAHVRRRAQVYDTWGFARKVDRGLGISTLFVGQSGTGKTMAAEVLARELGLDLYRIDLSQVVSKYIGETEKNLRRVFEAAEESGAILLFDEADALFGRRSEIKDSHDRYANIEVSYLLQRMEAYRGLAILTSNMKEAIDVAFMRRLRMVVRFPFPDAAQRALIWERVFPPELPRDGVDVEKLARLHVTGGAIRNIALNAAFFAAEADEPLRMRHLLRAARIECAKVEKNIGEHEIAGW